MVQNTYSYYTSFMKSEAMTLGQFAMVVGASPRWVQNALQVLGLERTYDEKRAGVLGLARQITEAFGIPLVRVHPMARDALAAWPETTVWRLEGPIGVAALEVDLERYLSVYAGRLALARNRYVERHRGRPPGRRKRGVAGAREHGVDIGLLEESLKRTPAERLRRLDEDVEFVGRLRVAEP